MHPSTRSLLSSCVALSAVLLTASSARGGDAAPSSHAGEALRVRVHGAADASAFAAAIAGELGVATTVVDSDAACTAPCVAVEVDGRARAGIAVVLASATRERAIDLPAGPDAAAEVVALVVGNLARDEAGALLAELSQPASMPEPAATLAPAPAFAATLGVDAPPAAASRPPALARPRTAAAVVGAGVDAGPDLDDRARADQRERPAPTRFGLGLVPYLGVELTGARGRPAGVAIDVLVGGRRRLAAFNVAGVGSIVTEDLVGTQIGGAFAMAGKVDGAQIGGAIAAAGAVRGTQIGGAVAVADRVKGAQIGGAVAVVAGDASAQVGGAIAVAGGTVDTQIAGALGVAGRVRGTQISGALNVAGRVDGVQVGVVNVAGGGDGVSIGLVNVVKGGRTELEGTLDNRGLANLVLRHGSRRWHNVYGVGGHADSTLVDREVSDQDVWMYGLGMGPSWKRGPATLDVEAMTWHVVYGGDFTSELDLLNQLRFVVGYPIGPATLVAGGAVNVYVTSDQTRDGVRALPRMTTPVVDDHEVHVQIWPTGFVGLRL